MNAAHITTAALAAAGTLVAALLLAAGPDTPDTPVLRIGTYDNRAVAIAYAASDLNPAKEKMAEMEKARAEGDEDAIKRLEHWGETHQRLLHFQGFGHYPVDDHLALVADKLPAIAEKHDLDAIVWLHHYTADNVEIVDVTKDLAALFDPPERVWRSIDQMRAHKPLDFETLIDLPAEH